MMPLNGQEGIYKNMCVCYQKQVKQSRYGQVVAQRFHRKLRFPEFITTAQAVGKVVSFTHRPPLPPGNTSDTHFC
jgi:hypothetical protein